MSTLTAGAKTATGRADFAAKTMDSWANSLESVLESMTGNRPEISVRASETRTVEDAFFWWGQSLSLVEQPSFWIGGPQESWTALGRLILSALGVEEPDNSTIESTCGDLLAQATAVVASKLTDRLGQEITGGASIPANLPNAAEGLVFLWSLHSGQLSIEGATVWSETLLCRCADLIPQIAATNDDLKEDVSANEAEFGDRPATPLPRLDLRVRFILGRTTLPLRQVFRLSTGSVIELDSSITEPTDVVIHGRVFARGQVVVVNGNYGLKILPNKA